MVHTFLSKLFKTGKDLDSHISFTKIGTLIVAIAGVYAVPPVTAVKVIIAIGGWLTAIGYRDALK